MTPIELAIYASEMKLLLIGLACLAAIFFAAALLFAFFFGTVNPRLRRADKRCSRLKAEAARRAGPDSLAQFGTARALEWKMRRRTVGGTALARQGRQARIGARVDDDALLRHRAFGTGLGLWPAAAVRRADVSRLRLRDLAGAHQQGAGEEVNRDTASTHSAPRCLVVPAV